MNKSRSPVNLTEGKNLSLPRRPRTRDRVARPEGIEPPTPGLEGRCSIRLSYGRRYRETRPGYLEVVGVRGFEPPTSCSQSRRATGLRYTPTKGQAL